METAARKRSKGKQDVTVLLDYDVAADAKNRISLRGANAKYFHVLALSNGSYMLEPRVLVPPDALPARTLKMLNRSVANLKKGKVSPPIDLSSYQNSDITILAIEPHPEDKKRGAYERIKLSKLAPPKGGKGGTK